MVLPNIKALFRLCCYSNIYILNDGVHFKVNFGIKSDGIGGGGGLWCSGKLRHRSKQVRTTVKHSLPD